MNVGAAISHIKVIVCSLTPSGGNCISLTHLPFSRRENVASDTITAVCRFSILQIY